MTFDSAQIPRNPAGSSRKWGRCDPAKEQDVIDFYLYNSDLVAETINTFAAAVKQFTHREKLVGVFYGYILQLCGEQRQQNAGHLALGKVLASPDIDFLTSPTSYAYRQVGGEGTCHYMSLLDSVKLHGKIWFNEDDIRTSLTEVPWDNGANQTRSQRISCSRKRNWLTPLPRVRPTGGSMWAAFDTMTRRS